MIFSEQNNFDFVVQENLLMRTFLKQWSLNTLDPVSSDTILVT